MTFSGARAAAAGKPVRYVTERAVFGLGPRGVEVLELAPGCDLERDVLAEMEFRPADRARSPADGSRDLRAATRSGSASALGGRGRRGAEA